MSTESEETLVWRGTPSQWTNFGTYVVCVFFAAGIVAAYLLIPSEPKNPLILAGLAIPVLWVLIRWIATRCRRYEITSERVKITTGLVSRQTSELELYRVRDYSVIEPFWLRLVGRGNVVLITSDRMTPQVVLAAVPSPGTLKDQIRAHTERMRQKRGVRDIEINSPLSPPPA